MREREPERPRADGGRLQAGGRRSPEAGRTAGPAPPGRQRRTGYYQRMNREDGSATANQPEAFSSSSGYEAPPEQAAPDSWREAQPDNQVRRPPDAVPSGRRRFGPDDTGRTFPADRPPGVEAPEEPGRLRFTPSDALNEGAGDLTRDKKRRGRQQARHDTGTGAAPEGGGGRLRFTKEEQRQAGDGGTTGPEPSGAADGDTGDGTGEAGSDTGDPRQARKTDKAKRRLDKATGKAQKARDNLPTQRRVRLKKEFDEDAGRPRRRLRFEQEVKPEGKRNPLARGALAVGRAVDLKVHQKIHEVEHENVGVEAAHKAEFTAENLAHDTVRFAYRHHKRAPYLRLHCNLTQMERAADDVLAVVAKIEEPDGLDRTNAAYYGAVQAYVTECRGQLNTGAYQLPEAPKKEDFIDPEYQAYREQVREEVKQEAAAAGLTVEQYAANGYEPRSSSQPVQEPTGTPAMDAIEAKVQRGEAVSLMAMVDAAKSDRAAGRAGKKPSVHDTLEAAKKAPAKPRKPRTKKAPAKDGPERS